MLQVEGWPLTSKRTYTGILKKSFIDKARVKAIQANVRLEEFGDSIQMLFREKKLEFDIKPFLDFIDHFHNNLIADYKIRKKLEATIQDLNDTVADITSNKDFIALEQKNYLKLIATKEEALESFILTYKK